MFEHGDVVERMTTPLEGGINKGTICVVKEIVDAVYMTLEGHDGMYRQEAFKLHEAHRGQTRQVSDLGSVVAALRVLDEWNRTHPTALMIGVEPYPVQDGGMVVTINNEGFNDPDEFYTYVSQYMGKADRKAALKRAMVLLESELEE